MTTTKIDNIYVDAVKRATPSAPVMVTSETIETGERIADYVTEEDETLTLDVYMADDHLVYYGVDDITVRAAQRVTSAADKRKAILGLKGTRLVNIVMPDERFTDFLLIDVQRDITAKNRKGFEATLLFQKIKTQTTGTVSVPADRLKKKPVAKQTAAAQQSPEENDGKVDVYDPEEVARKMYEQSILGATAGSETFGGY